MAVLLTDLTLRGMKAPAAGRVELWDSKVTGLCWRITAESVRTWSVFYRVKGRKRRVTLGPYRPEGAAIDGLTLGEARVKGREVLRALADGRDPQADKERARTEALRAGASVKDLAERWLREGKATKGPRAGKPWAAKTRTEFERLVRTEILPALGDLAPERVTKRDIRAVYDRIASRSPSVAKHTLAVLRLLYQWAAEEDHVDAVPLFPKRGSQSDRRTRVLDEDELRAVWKALYAGISTGENGDGGPGVIERAFLLMLLTAQRRGEVLSMRWADLSEERDGSWWLIPAERFKGGRDHRVPLTAPAVQLLKGLHSITGAGEWIFPTPHEHKGGPIRNPQKAAERLWTAVGLKGSAHVHDLRRTAATVMARLGVPRLVVGKVLGHAEAGATGRHYDAHAYDREKRAALRKWADELQRIAAAKPKDDARKVLPWAK